MFLLTSMLARITNTQSSWEKRKEKQMQREEEGMILHQNKQYKRINSLSIFLLKLLLKKIVSLNRTKRHKRMNESLGKEKKVSGLLLWISYSIFLFSSNFSFVMSLLYSKSHSSFLFPRSLSHILSFSHLNIMLGRLSFLIR